MDTTKLNSLNLAIQKLMANYSKTYDYVVSHSDWKNPFREIISKEIPALLTECAGLSSPYKVEGSYGKGRWTQVPWISIFDTRITSSAQHGVYIVYLLNKDAQELYLTFETAATETITPASPDGKKGAFVGIVGKLSTNVTDTLQEKAAKIRTLIGDSYFASDNLINSGASGYDAGAIYYKKYTLQSLPSGEKIIEDLQRMLEIYNKYYEMSSGSESIWEPSITEFNPQISTEQWLEMLTDQKTFTHNALVAMAAMYDYGGEASCKQLEEAYGRTSDFYRSSLGTQLASKVKQKYNLPYCQMNGQGYVWPIVFQGRKAKNDEPGNYVWRLRPELYTALGHFNIQQYLNGGEEEVPVLAKEYMKPIKDYIAAKGFSYDGRLIENFYLSLKTKPFVILAGTSGTGKTRLVKLFAKAIGAEYKLVPVRPDWSDSSDLFGHVDLNGKFVPGAVIDFIKSAQDHPGKPYILCLDEMNLARVEYYLSDVLSIIETRNWNDSTITSDPLIDLDKYGPDEDAKAKYGKICFPQNLYIVGTVNMDETTFPFSKKVLDRANTIEFNFVDLRPSFDAITDMPDKLQLPNSFLQSEYLLLAQCNKDVAFVSQICNELQQINEILQKANAHIGYRVRDEIVFYLLNNKNEGELLSRNEAMDNAIMQKILPRIQGSSTSIHDMLCELFKICGGDHNQRSGDSDADKMWKVVSDKSANCKYPNSAKKLQMMVRRFEEDGFTSFWL